MLDFIRKNFGANSHLKLGVNMKQAVSTQESIFREPYDSTFKYCLAGMLLAIWVLSTMRQIIIAIVLATVYSGIEFSWNFILDGVGHTTIHQWGANILYIPVMFPRMLVFFHSLGPIFALTFYGPILVYVLEIIEGYVLMIFFDGKNPAWIYPTRDSFAHGNCRWLYFPVWIPLGLILYLAHPILASLDFFKAPEVFLMS